MRSTVIHLLPCINPDGFEKAEPHPCPNDGLLIPSSSRYSNHSRNYNLSSNNYCFVAKFARFVYFLFVRFFFCVCFFLLRQRDNNNLIALFSRRENANSFDLNRNYPDKFNPHTIPMQSETRAIVEWMRSVHFVMSLSLHGGALVANYPYDGSSDSCKCTTLPWRN